MLGKAPLKSAKVFIVPKNTITHVLTTQQNTIKIVIDFHWMLKVQY